MSRKGWVKIWHKLADDPMWLEEPFTKGQAWVDLIMIANTVESRTPGEVKCSLKYLSRRWKWSVGKVKRFLIRLKNDGTVFGTLNGTENGTLLTIAKYSSYQNRGTANGTPNGTENGNKEEDKDALSSGSINEPERKKSGKDRKRVEKPCDDKRIPDYAKDAFPDFESYERWLKERL